jgi:hypothetical protein
MAKTKTERVAVWLNPDQIAWLKTKENVSATVRAMVTEAMNMERMKEMVAKKAGRGKTERLKGKRGS